jgi:integrase
MVASKVRIPSYRHYKPKNLAVVRLDGQDRYLGRYGSAESRERYDRLIAEWLLAKRDRAASSPSGVHPLPAGPATAVNELLLAFLRHATQRYVKNGRPTSEIRSFRTALKPVRELYGREPVTSFGPLALVACRQKLVDAGYCRKRINGHVSRVRLVFKWGVAREMVPESVWRALCAVEGLRRGEAPDRPPIRPVFEVHIKAIEKHVTPQIWAMIQLQLWTGCRPGEACDVRGMDVTKRDDVWEYRPASHKTEHHEKERVIFLGPQAQAVIRPWLKTDSTAYLFSPREARAWFHEQRAKHRKTPGPKRPRSRRAHPRRRCGERYSVRAYDRAVERACQRAGVDHWAPNQLRHAAATRLRSELGIELTRILLGHSSAVTSEVYAEADFEKARSAMQKFG